ncbi:MAG: DNA polymerase III subunit alpha [Candidatus Peribacteraceae bacterium]|nr:DNA polymerase III subunit alpha [Candidatus Peribacteraceae bacterium]
MRKKRLLEVQKFVHCHFHTEFSFLDSIITVKGLGKILRNKGFTACAITDHGNLNGVYRFVKDLKEAGVKPIVGIEAYYVADRHRRGLTDDEKAEVTEGLAKGETRAALKQAEKDSKVRKSNHIILLAKNHNGWLKIVRAIELAHKEGFYYRPRIDFDLLKDLAPDVIVTSACMTGPASSLIREDKVSEAFDWCGKVRDIFGEDFYIEIQPLDLEDQINLNPTLVDIAETLDIELVATNDCHYIESEDEETHDVLLAIRDSQHGKRVLITDEERFRYNTKVLSVKSRNEMQNAFLKWHPEIPEETWMRALDNTLEIVDKCEDEVLKFRKGVLPVVEVEDEYDNDPDKKLWALVNKGWKWREIQEKAKGKAGTIDWIDGQDPKRKPLYHVYKERVKYEMQEITRLGFSKYFLVIYDLIWWCRDEGIRPGPGRGSVAGSLVAYLLGITAVDSIKWDCPFSRFISPDRIDYPDIDMDFPTVERRKVKEYITEKYGQDQVASICNYSTMKGKMVLKDVARVHGVPYGETEAVVGHIITRASGDARGSACLEDTFREFAECRDYYKRYPEVVKHAMLLEGNVRQLGVNAAGMVVSDSPLREIAPVQYQRVAKNQSPDGAGVGEYLVGWDKREVEEIGLLKLDVLGIEGLTYLQRCIDLVEERHDVLVEPEEWEDLDDPEVFDQFQKGNTELVWQFNSQGGIRTLKKLLPDKFEHLMAATSLIRPGPLYSGITADYVARRHGKKVKSVHPMLDRILDKTYGLCIYQEGATQIVHDMANFTWAQADAVRKCISKKLGTEYMQRHRDLFFKGTRENKIDEDVAEKVWDAIGQFGQYSFNKCIVINTIINYNEWGEYTVEDVIDDFAWDEKVYLDSYDKNTGKKFQDECLEVIDCGEQEVYEVIFSDGFKVECTLDHKFLCEDSVYHTVQEILDGDLCLVRS